MSLTLSMLKSKIHRATVTQADVDYEGSVTLDASCCGRRTILPFEEVHVWNVTCAGRGCGPTRWWARPAREWCAQRGGGARHLAGPGDRVIIATFTELDEEAARGYRPKVILVDGENRIRDPNAEEIADPTCVESRTLSIIDCGEVEAHAVDSMGSDAE